MFKLKNHLKKWIALGVAILSMSLVGILPARAAAPIGGANGISGALLQLIADFTHNIAVTAYQTEKYTYAILTFINAWILPDTSQTTANMQYAFTNLANGVAQDAATQNALQSQITQEFLQGVAMPEINDMAYQTLLGQLSVSPDPRGKNATPAYNYIKNAAGLNITFPLPDNSKWTGNDNDKTNYKNFYMTVTAIQTYSAYLLSQVYADYSNKTQLTQQQNALMQQASSGSWFTQVASENIGLVLRQILMYNSQIYVLLTQLLQTQKQSLAAQAMTNTLIVIGNEFTGNQLLMRASKPQPKM